MGDAEANAEWVRKKIEDANLVDKIQALALIRYLSRFASEEMVFGMFAEIVEKLQDRYGSSNDEEAP